MDREERSGEELRELKGGRPVILVYLIYLTTSFIKKEGFKPSFQIREGSKL